MGDAGTVSLVVSSPVALMSNASLSEIPRCSPWLQLVAWLLGLLAAGVGAVDLLANWDPNLALIDFVLLAMAPLVWMQRPQPDAASRLRFWWNRDGQSRAWLLCGVVGLTSLAVSTWIGRHFTGLPPAYHDEYSYLFQARTFLAGRIWFPSHPTHPELFDQMHVLNEGRYASRYFPGAGLWLTPFVALDHPYWGYWLAGAITSMLTFWTGRELSGNGVGLVAGMVTALSPGMGLFSNLLLAHHPTLVGLSLFLFTFVRLQRARWWLDALLAGIGLSFAMICRPATAAGIGLPFGVWFLGWLGQGLRRTKQTAAASQPTIRPFVARLRLAVWLGLPLVMSFVGLFCYNRAITGSGWVAPYQLYTDLHTPRHVYGFNNVVRGERHLGPKVIEVYDRWAENLTPALAAQNVVIRLLASWQWTLDLVPLLLASVVFLAQPLRPCLRWWLVFAAIVSLHVAHIPYWYVGIMGWHYVFETGPLWALVFARATEMLIESWRASGRTWMPVWWGTLTVVTWLGIYAPLDTIWQPRIDLGIGNIAFPRRLHAEFQQAVEQTVTARPALVLIQEDAPNRHLDYVINDPSLRGEILIGRYQPEKMELADVARDFPDRALYLMRLHEGRVRRIERLR